MTITTASACCKAVSCLLIIMVGYCHVFGYSSLIVMFSIDGFWDSDTVNKISARLDFGMHNSTKICENPENVHCGLRFFYIPVECANGLLIPRP